MAPPPAVPDPNILWWELSAEFLCSCEYGTDIDDCTLPSRVVCGECGKAWRIAVVITPEEAVAS